MVLKFNALVKEVKVKALASLDKGFQVILQGEDEGMAQLVNCPADKECQISITWEE